MLLDQDENTGKRNGPCPQGAKTPKRLYAVLA